MLALLNLVIDPVFKAGIVNVLDASGALAEADQWIVFVVAAVEAYPTLILHAYVALTRNALHLCYFLHVDALGIEVLLRKLLLLLHYLLQFQLYLADLDGHAGQDRTQLSLCKHPPQRVLLCSFIDKFQATTVYLHTVDGSFSPAISLVYKIISPLKEIALWGDDLIGEYAVV